jgi:hypothetical protein
MGGGGVVCAHRDDEDHTNRLRSGELTDAARGLEHGAFSIEDGYGLLASASILAELAVLFVDQRGVE